MSSKPRVAVLSSTAFGYRCIAEGILPVDKVELCGVISTPPEISISYSDKPITIFRHADFQPLADENDFPVVIFDSSPKVENYLHYCHEWQVDMMLALGWYYLVPAAVRERLPLGCLGIHASLLPKYRGGAPLVWAMINGESETGVTLFYLEDGVDAGDIVGQRKFPITDSDTAATIQAKAEGEAVGLLLHSLPLLARNNAPRIKQDESQATTYPQRRPVDGEIDWSWPPGRIRNFIRAQTRPYPGAWTVIAGKKVTIWDADVRLDNL